MLLHVVGMQDNSTTTENWINEIAQSFATLDAETPREVFLPCPQCVSEMTIWKDQLRDVWQLACCQHAESHRIRSKAVARWNRWATPWTPSLS